LFSGVAEGKIDLPFDQPPTGTPPKPKRGPKPSRSGGDQGRNDDSFDQLELFQ
jgi:hypothetical protein